MSPTTENLLNTALTLPEEDRLGLAEALLASLQRDGRPPLDESWKAVIQRRSAELATGAVTPIPWQEVKRRANAEAETDG